jgi:membrane fusion protein, multidrug efflux system
MKHPSIEPLVFALILLLGVAGCSRPAPTVEPIRSVKTVKISAQSAAGTLEYAGEVKARTESRLGFRVGGKITSRPAALGQSVKAGQVLARLDPQDLKLGEEAAAAALTAARANLELASADYGRFKELLDKGFISSAELERRDTALRSARAQFDQAKAQASAQGNQAGYAVLVADANGVITGIDAEPGMVVAAGAPVLRLAHDGARDVVFAVPEDRVGAIKALAGKSGAFKIRLWGGNEQTHSATIREIAAAADPLTRTFQVKADVGHVRALRLGQTATVIADLPRAAGVIKLPLSALREEQGKSAVWVFDDVTSTVSLHPVQVAGADGNEVVIAGGLVPGQTVVTAGVHVLTAGQKVRLYLEPGTVAGAADSGQRPMR